MKSKGPCCFPTSVVLWSRCHATNNNIYNSCYNNIREKKEGGGAPFLSFIYLFFIVVFCVLAIGIEKEEGEEGKKKKRRKKKTKWGGGGGSGES